MTAAQPLSSAARAGAGSSAARSANNGAPDAEVINGEIVMWMDGRRKPVRPALAWSEWLWLHDSPVPETRERAKTIRAALDQIGYLQ